MVTFVEDNKDVDIYLNLRKQVGWIELSRQQAQMALDNSLKIITVYDDERPIGMGRIVGDGAVISYIQDLIIIPEYQSRHIGSLLIERLIDFVKSITIKGTRMMLCLMCAKGREIFYEKHGFIARPTDQLGPGMIQYIRIDEV
jgi:GNAT superfamily N-acetyltransferase